MDYIKESNEYTETIFIIKIDTLVKGYDGTDIGPANQQAQGLANRTTYLKGKVDDLISQLKELTNRPYVASINDKSGTVTISYSDVGADKEGTAKDLLESHLAAEDPHPQYLTKADGSNTYLTKKEGSDTYLTKTEGTDLYVGKSEANKPNGYLKLDANGYLPSNISTLYEVRYKIAKDKTERLAIEKSKNLTIVLQLDENRIYYLDSDEDPSVEDNWKAGRSADVSDVVSVFGRAGVITAEPGDYNTEQITETDTKVFVSPSDKQNWDSKQEKLTSSKNIKTLNKVSLLGEGDIAVTPEGIGAANKKHTHTPDEIITDTNNQFVSDTEKETWNAKQENLVSGESIKTLNKGSLLGEGDISVTPETIGAAEKEHTHSPDEIKTDENKQFISSTDRKSWDAKQDALVSGTSIKTVNNTTLLGEGDVAITPESINAADKEHTHVATDIETDEDNQFISGVDRSNWDGKQDALVSGVNIATLFGKSILEEKSITIRDVSGFAKYLSEVIKGEGGLTVTLSDDQKTVTLTQKNRGITVVNVPDASANTAYAYDADEDNFNFTAYALKEVAQTGDQNFKINYDNQLANCPRTAVPSYDDNGYVIDTTLNNSGTLKWTSTIYMLADYAPVVSSLYTRISVQKSYKSQVPAMTSAASSLPFNPIAVGMRGGMEAYKAFQEEMLPKDTSSVATNNYWSDSTVFNKRTIDVYLGIDCGRSLEVNGYGLQTFKKFAATNVTPPTRWVFEGSDTKSNWVALDTQSNQSLTSGLDDWKRYVLPEPVQYRYYRIRILSVTDPTKYASIPRFQIYANNRVLLKTKNNQYYSINSSGELVSVDSTLKNIYSLYGFYDTPLIKSSVINAIAPVDIVSDAVATVDFEYRVTSTQMVAHYPLRNVSVWNDLKQIGVTSYYNSSSDPSGIKWAATTDGSTYYTIKSGDSSWTNIGKISVNTTGAEKVYSSGQPLSSLTNVTQDQWAALLAAGGNSARLGLAYSTVIQKKTDSVSPKYLEGQFSEITSWNKLSEEQVIISLSKNQIIFKPSVAGNYKFCYQFF